MLISLYKPIIIEFLYFNVLLSSGSRKIFHSHTVIFFSQLQRLGKKNCPDLSSQIEEQQTSEKWQQINAQPSLTRTRVASSSMWQFTKWSDHKTRFPVIAPSMQITIDCVQSKTPIRCRHESETQSRKTKISEDSESVKVKFYCHMGFTPGAKKSCAWASSPWAILHEQYSLIDSTGWVHWDLQIVKA